ncbi:MAG: hypothetical protein SVO26_06245 [Chloroflexota bacterium]|nr:hypothetical protein [Chloroflexota bacterium]
MSSYESANLNITATGENEAIQHLKQAIFAGKPWYIALLEAIGLWTCSEENHNGYCYRYLIDGEAFDWLLLAERLCMEVAEHIPEEELTDLLFFGRLPEDVSDDEFREIIGSAKYQAHLNYVYGVTIEKFIVLAVEEEIEKERQCYVFSDDVESVVDSYQRIYGADQTQLLRWFREEKGYAKTKRMSVSELQEFTYWLFKYRLRNCDKARVASDTRKGLEYFRRQKQAGDQ